MANITVAFGAILILLGVGTFALTGYEHVTALIPAFFGLPLGLLGILARKDHLRKHVMHAAVLLGLVGCIGAAVMSIPAVPTLVKEGKVIKENKDGTTRDATRAVIAQLAMTAVCAVFTGLCVKSFIDVRRTRKANATMTGPQ